MRTKLPFVNALSVRSITFTRNKSPIVQFESCKVVSTLTSPVALNNWQSTTAYNCRYRRLKFKGKRFVVGLNRVRFNEILRR